MSGKRFSSFQENENEQICDPNFVWYVETSSAGDINLMSYHLTAFDLTDQLLYIIFQASNVQFFRKI